ncbi:MAG: ABC transporter substrate-binding protein [Bacteroidetes bacterium]|nr:ABC transporter substrate-binding protein [Bacteroidota bacterium]
MFLQNTVLPDPPLRIVSLVPSQTELLYYLGLETETIAITRFCVHPEHWFRSKTRIGGTKALHLEKIKELTPDLIIANNEENVKEQVEALAELFPVWVTDVKTLDDALQMIIDVGNLTHRVAGAVRLTESIKQSFSELDQMITGTKPVNAAYLIWRDPYMSIGNDTFIHDLMQRAGLQNIFSYTTRYPDITINQLKEKNCELILLSSEPYPFSEKHVKELQDALPEMPVMLVDGEMFSWYGSRLLDAAAYLKELFIKVKR